MFWQNENWISWNLYWSRTLVAGEKGNLMLCVVFYLSLSRRLGSLCGLWQSENVDCKQQRACGSKCSALKCTKRIVLYEPIVWWHSFRHSLTLILVLAVGIGCKRCDRKLMLLELTTIWHLLLGIGHELVLCQNSANFTHGWKSGSGELHANSPLMQLTPSKWKM